MSDYGATFKYGGVIYPITSSTTNSLLQDADPSLYYALNFCASVLTTHLQTRLLAEVARAPSMTNITAAVKMALPWDPVPFLNDAQIQFPLLAIYRKSEKNVWKVQSYMDDVSEWGVQYILPPITAGQAERVSPILRAVSRVLMNRIENKMDDGYLSGADVWALAQLEEIYLDRGQYGAYEGTHSSIIFPAWMGTLTVKERDMPITATQFQVLGGLDDALDVVPSDGSATLADVVDSQLTFFDPTAPTMAFYADTSVTSTNGVISAWSAATTVSGSPLLASDTVAGHPLVRTRNADKLFTPAGAAAFLSSGACTITFVWRFRTNGTSGITPFLDTSELGTKVGLQIQIGDQGNGIVYGRSISIREWNGSSWSLDSTALAISSGAFIPQKAQVVTIRLTNTFLDIRVDGQSVKQGGIAITRSYASGTTGKLAIGGSIADCQAIELRNTLLSDADVYTAEQRLATRFGAKPSVLIEGDPNFVSAVTSACFPWISKLPGGKLYVTCYNGTDGVNVTDHNDAFLSADGGKTWTGPTVLTTSSGGTPYSDLKTSEPLADGSVIQVTMTYTSLGGGFKNVIFRRATTYNPDGSPIWPATWTDILTGSPTWSATNCAPTEDPNNLGTLHMAVTTIEGSDTKGSAWDYVTTNAGVTWTRTRVANGQSLGIDCQETFLWFEGNEIRYHVRDNTTTSGHILATHSTDHGATWASLVDVNLPAHSSAQQVKRLIDGNRVFAGRRIGSSVKGGLFFQPAASAYNGNWSSTVIEFDPLFGGFYYAGIYEVSPGKLVLVAARNTGPGLNVAAYFIDEFILNGLSMPGTVTPATVSLNVNTTQQLTVTGAGDYTYAVTTNNSGGSVNSTGLYTAGAANGVDTVSVTDLNGYVVGTCVATVSGAAVVPTLSSIVPDFGTAAGGSTNVVLTGTLLTGAISVTIGGVAATITGNTATTVTVTVGAKAASNANDVVVTTSGGSATLSGAFTYMPAGYLWAHTADIVTLSGVMITAMPDQSGNGRNLTPPGSNPTLVTGASGINNHNAVLFAGADKLTWSSFPTPTALDCFFVFQNADDGTTTGGALSITDDNQACCFPLSSFTRHLFDGCGSTTRQSSGVFAPATGAWALPWSYNAVSTSAHWIGRFNGTQFDSYNTNAVGYSIRAIGHGSTFGTDYIGGMFAFDIAWGAELTSGDRTVVQTYIHTKYNA